MRDLFFLTYAYLIELYRRSLMSSTKTMPLIFAPKFNRFRRFNSTARTYAEFLKARRRVPAYRDFLRKHGFEKMTFKGLMPRLETIPVMDKESYVKLYPLEERCNYGKIPTKDVVIDESSGSTGIPTNWLRGKKERKRNSRFIQFGMRNLLGNGPLFVINGFALGPWATGMNISMTCVKFAILKSLGPDEQKIINTLIQFGNKHHYVIMGYPPFLKLLVERAPIDWKDYNVTLIFGGESMSEGMRDYLLNKGIRNIYSSFGASDLELNISAENDFTISIRRLIRDNPQFRARICKFPGAVPMLFQYNTSDFLIEPNEQGELVISIARPHYIAPKLKYNIHDKGHIVDIEHVYELMDELNIPRTSILKPQTDLPLLFHYGRSDLTVSFFGSNISPNDIQETIFSKKEFTELIHSFCIQLNENSEGDKFLELELELVAGLHDLPLSKEEFSNAFFEQLAVINQDFREAKRMIVNPAQLAITYFPFGTGPFEDRDMRIKAKYLS